MPENICPVCNDPIKRTSKYLKCGSYCDNLYHQKCAKLSDKMYDLVLDNVNICWRCDFCIQRRSRDMYSIIEKIYSTTEKLSEDFKQHQETLKKHEDILQNLKEKVDYGHADDCSKTKVVSYAEKTKKNKPVLVIKPKNDKQTSETTKEDLKEKIDPTEADINRLKKVAKGGVAISCSNVESLEKLKEETEKKLGDKYNVNIPSAKKPRIKIVGLTEKPNEENIIEYIKKQNHYIKEDSIIKVEHIYKVEKGRNIRYSIIIQVDGDTHFNIVRNKEIIIGWDVCAAYDHLEITRCYKCCGYYHKASKCNKEQCCARCGGDHRVQNCSSNVEKCVNCEGANKKLNMKIISDHNSWSPDCPVFKRMIDAERNKIDYSI